MKPSLKRKIISFSILSILMLFSKTYTKKLIDASTICYTRILPIKKQIGNVLDEVRWSVGEIITDMSTTIIFSGLFVLTQDVQEVIIDSSDVVLNLNGYEVASTTTAITITSNKENVVIKNGSVRGGSCDSKVDAPGIWIEDGTELVQIDRVNIYGFDIGIFLNGSSTNSIRSCDLRNNILFCNNKGLVANYTIKSTFENNEALNNVEAGFELNNSKYNYFYQCKALEIKNTDATESAVGFYSKSGTGNIFIECVANGTEKTYSEFGYNATGFLFKGTSILAGETESEIYNCIANKSKGAGEGNAYGIHLDMILRDTNTYDVLASPTTTHDWLEDANAVDWSNESKFIAVGYDYNAADHLRVYSYEDYTISFFCIC